MLMVRGPNVMAGYLNRPELTREVIVDGWYRTGDIAKVDTDGFITITDRLSRFSKVGGEMVPHGRVEEVLHETLQTSELVFAVAGVPDARRGEQLIVLHTPFTMPVEELLSKSAEKLPPLWLPNRNAFYPVDAIPALGTGKLDLQRSRNWRSKSQVLPAPLESAEASIPIIDLGQDRLFPDHALT